MINLIRKISHAIILLMATCGWSSAQQRLSIDSVYSAVSGRLTQETVYLQTDKDRYVAGDTLWFKAYLFAGGFPSEKSTGLHIDLFGPDGNLLQHKYYPVFRGGFSPGDLEFDDSLQQGLYTIRAYTEWMSNFDPAFFYKYTFPLYRIPGSVLPAKSGVGQDKSSTASGIGTTNTPVFPAGPAATAATATKVDIQFLPEGGDAVSNVLTNMAFRATDEHGLPVKVNGKIVDDLDTEVAKFQSIHDGMGAFPFTPLNGRTYTAVVETPYGERQVRLPSPKDDGVVLNMILSKNGVVFVLRADPTSRYLGQKVKVAASMYGQLLYEANPVLPADASLVGGMIPTDKFVQGILTVTLFDKNELPLAERIVFIRPGDIKIHASLSLDTVDTGSRGLNSWKLHFQDSSSTHLSVSVTDADVLTPAGNQQTILPGLLLGGMLKGNVYRPDWYFRNDSDSTQAALDLVMLTHGWRRFDWVALENGNFPATAYNDKTFLHFQGRVSAKTGEKAITNTTLIAFLKGKDFANKMIFLPVDGSGNFAIDSLLFFDTAIVYFQINGKEDGAKNVELKLKPAPGFPFSSEDRKGVVFPPQEEDSTFVGNSERTAISLASVRKRPDIKELKKVVIRARKKTPLEEIDQKYTKGLFSGGISHPFDLLNDYPEAASFPDVISFLRGRAPGLYISGNAYADMGIHHYSDGKSTINVTYRGGTPAFFVNESLVDVDVLTNVPMADIAYIKVFAPPFFGAPGGGMYGAIAVYTRIGTDGNKSAAEEGLNRLALTGYAPLRQFYSPVYNKQDTDSMRSPDYRTTLVWAPLLFSGPDAQTVPIRFYNNDSSRHFRIVAEGVDEHGRLFHFEQVIGKR